MDYRFRPGSVGDLAAVLSLWAESDAEPTHTDDVTSLTALIERDPEALILAEVGSRIIGTVIAAWDGWRGSIYRLVVAPDCRHAGLGRDLLRRAEVQLSAVGAKRLSAIVVETSPDAVGFWRASGWEEQAERLRFVRG